MKPEDEAILLANTIVAQDLAERGELVVSNHLVRMGNSIRELSAEVNEAKKDYALLELEANEYEEDRDRNAELWEAMKAEVERLKSRTVVGMTPGWVPSYGDPDNASGAPEAEPITLSDIERENSQVKAERDRLAGENAKLREALEAAIKQLEHVETLRAMDWGPVPETLTPDVIADAKAALAQAGQELAGVPAKAELPIWPSRSPTCGLT